jgi:hypothetical protein
VPRILPKVRKCVEHLGTQKADRIGVTWNTFSIGGCAPSTVSAR